MSHSPFSPEELREIRQLRKDGWSFEKISERTGRSRSSMQFALAKRGGDAALERKREENRHPSPNCNIVIKDQRPGTERELLELLRAIPQDTRDTTGRLMGDPVWERSALYQRNRRAG